MPCQCTAAFSLIGKVDLLFYGTTGILPAATTAARRYDQDG